MDALFSIEANNFLSKLFMRNYILRSLAESPDPAMAQ